MSGMAAGVAACVAYDLETRQPGQPCAGAVSPEVVAGLFTSGAP
jgi:hypothetical protein